MKQVVLDLSSGETMVIEVPAPAIRPGGVIVKNLYSVISLGTENTLVKFAKKNLVGKAQERPDLFKAFLDKAKRDGFLVAFQQAQRRLEKYIPLGYSSAGIVTEVASDVTEFRVGDKVACAGAEYAWHADTVFVPKNLLAKVPDDVDLKDAAFTTISSIALNGIRCISPEIGQTIVIIGLGLLGLLAVQIAKASGCRVIGIDLDERKVKMAQQLGIDLALARVPENESTVIEFTGGTGADAVIITASSESNDTVELAGKIARNRGKISIIGAVSLDIPREYYYKKELSVIIPSSYGPGRYDRNYEEMGHDYPVSFVRWTISRNMQTVLHLIKEKKLLPSKLVTDTFSIDSSPNAYAKLDGGALNIGLVIKYDEESKLEDSSVIHIHHAEPKSGLIRCGIVGAGTYATSVAIPLISKTKEFSLEAVSTASGLNARSAADKYKIPKMYSDYHALLEDDSIDLIFIMTRNSLHAPILLEALKKEKNVFVEKPLAVNSEEIDEIEKTWTRYKKTVMVGFNRRYAPFTNEIKTFFKNRTTPMIASYRVNAEEILSDHWIYDKKEGGGRIISEAPHFIDYLSYIIGSKPTRVFTNPIQSEKKHDTMDNFIIDIDFEDGSSGSVIYTSHGNKKFSKERAEFFADNKSVVLDNFRELKLVSNNKTTSKKNLFSQDKGHKNELDFLAKSLKNGDMIENEFRMSLLSSRATIAALKSIISRVPEQV